VGHDGEGSGRRNRPPGTIDRTGGAR
jgi:hypothetical protein